MTQLFTTFTIQGSLLVLCLLLADGSSTSEAVNKGGFSRRPAVNPAAVDAAADVRHGFDAALRADQQPADPDGSTTAKPKSHGLSVYAIIGISVGGFVLIFVVVVVLLCAVCYCMRKSRSRANGGIKSSESGMAGVQFDDEISKSAAQNGDIGRQMEAIDGMHRLSVGPTPPGPLMMNGAANPELRFAGPPLTSTPILDVGSPVPEQYVVEAEQPYAGALNDAISKYVPTLRPQMAEPLHRPPVEKLKDRKHKSKQSPPQRHHHTTPVETVEPVPIPPVQVQGEAYGPSTVPPVGYVKQIVPDAGVSAPAAYNNPPAAVYEFSSSVPQYAADGRPMITGVQRDPIGGPGGVPTYLPHLRIPGTAPGGGEEGIPPSNPAYISEGDIDVYRPPARDPSRPPFPGARPLPGMTRNLRVGGEKGLHRYGGGEY